ncbi:MAG: COX15/CtaA family protein [Gemmatimonadota bacterium]
MTSNSDRLVRRWLLWSIATILLVVVVGGATRLTESGLSITEWRPVTGVLPPMSHEGWAAAYTRYLAIPEAQSIHLGITLPEFQMLFWWEWVHRLLARLVGLVLAVPYFMLLAKGHLRPEHRWRLLSLPILAAAQGVLGWYMVSSGLGARINVSPYRLAAHLGMALLIYGICLWTVLDLGRRDSGGGWSASASVRRGFGLALVCVVTTMLSGAFVAGLDAGMMYNTFPLMGGKVVPAGYRIPDLGWRNAFENPVAAQFNHRVLAIGTAALILMLALLTRRASDSRGDRRAATAAGLAVLLQVAVGITTLLLVVPVALGVLHQATGLLVLATVVVVVHRSRRTATDG